MSDFHDLCLHSGERQTASRYEDIRADHRFRYEWANERLPHGSFGLDVFCGNGYGTYLLGKSRIVWGIDGSAEAIRQAEVHYRDAGAWFSVGYFPFTLGTHNFDFVVSLESIEHVSDDGRFLDELVRSLKVGGNLILSTPSEERLPLAGTGNHFHYRHYGVEQTMHLVRSRGLDIVEVAAQDVYLLNDDSVPNGQLPPEGMCLKSGSDGQFLILHCRKAHGY